jgi:hypothetical protein
MNLYFEKGKRIIVHIEVNAKYLAGKQLASFAKKEGFFSVA